MGKNHYNVVKRFSHTDYAYDKKIHKTVIYISI